MNVSPFALRPSLLLLCAVSALLGAACSGFSSSESGSGPSDAGALPDAGDDALPIVDDAAAMDAGADSLDEAGCPTANEKDGSVGNRVFVSAFSGKGGSFGGIVGADKICNDAAISASLGGKWHAWLSTPTCPVSSRFADRERVLARKDSSLGTLGPGKLPANYINADENGGVFANPGVSVWTGTDQTGGATANHCSNWSTSDPDASMGTKGFTNTKGIPWTDYGTLGCDAVAHLYCFEL